MSQLCEHGRRIGKEQCLKCIAAHLAEQRKDGGRYWMSWKKKRARERKRALYVDRKK